MVVVAKAECEKIYCPLEVAPHILRQDKELHTGDNTEEELIADMKKPSEKLSKKSSDEIFFLPKVPDKLRLPRHVDHEHLAQEGCKASEVERGSNTMIPLTFVLFAMPSETQTCLQYVLNFDDNVPDYACDLDLMQNHPLATTIAYPSFNSSTVIGPPGFDDLGDLCSFRLDHPRCP
ncbi:hypothetical protein BGZ65_010261 [Modicella reniformis]|uniref:Uncharacterized protein n=1 Tax=Modicella reniformis TaxID=1440133 RepID=A0A9P6SVH9_9FUNG|nr:hypothetical protein BGZ65_010261 [Modicella reniformis]